MEPVAIAGRNGSEVSNLLRPPILQLGILYLAANMKVGMAQRKVATLNLSTIREIIGWLWPLPEDTTLALQGFTASQEAT